MSVENAYRLGKLILIGMAIQLLVIGYVFFQSYKGRENVVLHAREGCERAKLDRSVNAEGWRIAEDARRSAGDIAVADKYASIASSLESRSRINCTEKFPKAGLLP
jgi:hypothetical protein